MGLLLTVIVGVRSVRQWLLGLGMTLSCLTGECYCGAIFSCVINKVFYMLGRELESVCGGDGEVL